MTYFDWEPCCLCGNQIASGTTCPCELDVDVCGETYDHSFPEPEFVDGIAELMCRECGAIILIDGVDA